ncbi:MAG: hypothetical protein AAGD96_19635 [Chloroflexota bacterium]
MLSFTQTFLSTTFLLGIGAFIFMATGAFIGYSVSKQTSTPSLPKLPYWLFGLIAVWFGVAIATSTAGLISLELVAPFAIFPIFIGWGLSYTKPLKNIIQGIPTHWLVSLQFYRVAGAIFIFPYLTEGYLTRGFALNAGIGDVLTGLIALPTAWLILRDGHARWRNLFLFWTAFGILDLLVAPASAAYFGFAAEGVVPSFPITTIPLFFGPPFGILIHIITARNFFLRSATVEETNSQLQPQVG